uniref:non-specific serine/threonine protein kinase n=1 Tax=Clastoptera arizonana TaxID=38151 RepID=A0A1B6CD91_9HEMI
MSSLNHPNVIKYIHSFLNDDCLVIIMEYATKGTLNDYLNQQKGKLLSQEKILHIFGQLCLALQYLHSKNILHRDITTNNILLTGCYQHVIKLSDFGLSKVLSSKSRNSSLVGTPCYLSPELCQGRAYGIHSDIWALGCVLYNMCTLKQAFQAQVSY